MEGGDIVTRLAKFLAARWLLFKGYCAIPDLTFGDMRKYTDARINTLINYRMGEDTMHDIAAMCFAELLSLHKKEYQKLHVDTDNGIRALLGDD